MKKADEEMKSLVKKPEGERVSLKTIDKPSEKGIEVKTEKVEKDGNRASILKKALIPALTTGLGLAFGGLKGGAAGAGKGVSALEGLSKEEEALRKEKEREALKSEEKAEALRKEEAVEKRFQTQQQKQEEMFQKRLTAEQEKEQRQAARKKAEQEREYSFKAQQEKIRADQQERLAQQKAKMASEKKAAPGSFKGTQYQAAGFGRRMQQAEETFKRLYEEQGYDPTGLAQRIQDLPFIPSEAKSTERLQKEQAERNFVNAVLRRESGAAIAESEFESAQKQYFPQPGDSPEVLAQKKRNREQAISMMSAEAGGAWEQVPLVSAEGAAAKQAPEDKDERVSQYAEQYGMDYEDALEILRRRGL